MVRRAGLAARRDGEDRELVLRRIAGEEDAKRAIAAVLGRMGDDPNTVSQQVCYDPLLLSIPLHLS